MPRINESERYEDAAFCEAQYNKKEVSPANDSQLAVLESQLDSLHDMIERAFADLVGPTPLTTNCVESASGITNRLACMGDRIAAMSSCMSEVCDILHKIERGS